MNKYSFYELENELLEWESSLQSDVMSLGDLDQNDEFYKQDYEFYCEEIEHAEKMITTLKKRIESAKRHAL